MNWIISNVKDLKEFENESFDVIFDKATMDALVTDEGSQWKPNPETVEDCKLMCQDFQDVKPLYDASQKLGVKPGLLVLVSFFACLFFVVLGFLGKFLTSVVGILYPGYMSFKAIETKDDNDDKQWLTYWVVFGFLHIFDAPLGWLLSFFPFYYPLKLMFYIFLFYPKTKGALKIYNSFLREKISKYQSFIDGYLKKDSK
ncbi:TB2 HVA22 family protein, putative [Ichthyophthirius multifiliis]|uniref:TB2 HVA22 family protein, putative n=1 Tax=Ichthyophthirius multifiliis TaxID=5932 RepID=G0QTL7_ICHMU|nr:TB2 HVA22 family protein, putative [Ichthyophthirius multifiliis]EGR31443.1 TB2 HVA22 family protein, putative [Ichthyophthirius multifiliis]|eukprot:XP_004034929.1 TB2 HVA22 family protein, putative [Ichthyophthirius multifiliis]